MHRRNFIKTAATVAAIGGAGLGQDLPSHNWDRYDFGPGPLVADRLDQGPFGIEQDQAWVNADGSLTIQLLRHDDKRWRKGV